MLPGQQVDIWRNRFVILSLAVTLSHAFRRINSIEISTAARSRNRFSVRQGKLIRVVCFYSEIFFIVLNYVLRH